jgi:hypothetical protein
VDEFKLGVEALGKLNERLSALIDKHDHWQNLEVELNMLETFVNHDLNQLAMAWADVKQKAESLYTATTEKWANELIQESISLDKAMNGNNPASIRRCFLNYQRLATNHFFQIDLELKLLCGNLRQIGTPLASILEKIK